MFYCNLDKNKAGELPYYYLFLFKLILVISRDPKL